MTRIIIFFFASMVILGFQSADEIKLIDSYKQSINTHFENNELEVKPANHKSPICGNITGYYFEDKLVLIKTSNTTEYGYHTFSFYVKNELLVFVSEQHKNTKVPENKAEFDDYIAKHTDRRGNTDLSKLPLSTNEDNVFYISNQKILTEKIKRFNKPVALTNEELLVKSKGIESYYQSAITELNFK